MTVIVSSWWMSNQNIRVTSSKCMMTSKCHDICNLVQDKQQTCQGDWHCAVYFGWCQGKSCQNPPPLFVIVIWVSLWLFNTILHVWTINSFLCDLNFFLWQSVFVLPHLLLQDYSYLHFQLFPWNSIHFVLKQWLGWPLIWSLGNLYINPSLNESCNFKLTFNISQ